MPLTPFHLGPALLLSALLYRRLDLPTLLAGSVIVDVRAALVVFGPLTGRVHGALTTVAGGTAVALALAGAVLALPRWVDALLDRVRLADTATASAVLAAALAGVYSHVALDSLLYADARPLYPLDWNPLLVGGPAVAPVYGGCALAGLFGAAVYAVRYRRRRGADA